MFWDAASISWNSGFHFWLPLLASNWGATYNFENIPASECWKPMKNSNVTFHFMMFLKIRIITITYRYYYIQIISSFDYHDLLILLNWFQNNTGPTWCIPSVQLSGPGSVLHLRQDLIRNKHMFVLPKKKHLHPWKLTWQAENPHFQFFIVMLVFGEQIQMFDLSVFSQRKHHLNHWTIGSKWSGTYE